MPTIRVTSSYDQQYLQSPQQCCPLSVSRTAVTDLTNDMTRLAIQRGKSLHPSRIFSQNISKVSRLRKPVSGLLFRGGTALSVLQDQQYTPSNQPSLSNHQKHELNNNIKNVFPSTQNCNNYRSNHTKQIVTENISKPCRMAHWQVVKSSSASISNNDNANKSPLVDRGYRTTPTLNTLNNSIQLLHPHWRKVPWISQFGWTDAHQRHCEWLKLQVRTGAVPSIFYNSPDEYLKVEQTWPRHNRGLSFLSGPCANTVAEVLDILHRTHYSRQQSRPYKHPKLCYRREVSEYDADVEDIV